jgi:hypothetical protein
MPVCKTCAVDYPEEGFHKSPTCKGGRRSVCKQCVAVERKQFRDANKALVAEQKRDSRIRNIEKCRAKDAKYYANNKAKHAAAGKSWYERNKESAKARAKAWADANPERVKAAKAKNKLTRKDTVKAEYKRNKADYFARAAARRATIKDATPQWADKEAIAEMYVIAGKLNSFFTKPIVHVDHIVPLNNPLVCGLHTEANLQVLSAKANLSKRNRHWPDMP